MTDRMMELHRIFHAEFSKLRDKYPDKSMTELVRLSSTDPSYMSLVDEMRELTKDLSNDEVTEQAEKAETIIRLEKEISNVK